MQINKQPSFKAKFSNTESMQKVVKYAVEKGKFDKLNTARKNIENFDWFTKLEMNCGFEEKNQQSFFEIIRYKPVYKMINGKLEKTFLTKSTRKYYPTKNPIKLAFEKIIKMSNCAPKNNLYKGKTVSYTGQAP